MFDLFLPAPMVYTDSIKNGLLHCGILQRFMSLLITSSHVATWQSTVWYNVVWPPVLERVKHFLNSNIYIAMDIDAEALNVISSPGSTLFSFSVNLYGSHTLGYIGHSSAPEN